MTAMQLAAENRVCERDVFPDIELDTRSLAVNPDLIAAIFRRNMTALVAEAVARGQRERVRSAPVGRSD